MSGSDDRFPTVAAAGFTPAQIRAIGGMIEAILTARMSEVWTSAMGVVESFNSVKRTAKVVIAGQDTFQGELAQGTSRPVVLEDVPVLMTAYLVGDVLPGAEALVVFTRRDVDLFVATGQTAFTPRSKRRFSPSDGFCIPMTHRSSKIDADKGVARLDDTVKKITAMATWMTQVETAINILAPGAVTPLSTTFGLGQIDSASGTVKAKG